MQKLFEKINLLELGVTMVCVVGFTSVLMLGAIMRLVGHPLNWCNDMAMLLLAWATFLGGDVAFRGGRMVNVDIIVQKFPVKVQKTVAVLVYALLIVMMVTMVWQGITLCRNVGARTLEGVADISYAWVAASVPTGFALMTLTAVWRLVGLLRSDDPAVISKM